MFAAESSLYVVGCALCVACCELAGVCCLCLVVRGLLIVVV